MKCFFFNHKFTTWGSPVDSYFGPIKQARVCEKCGKIEVRNLGYIDGLKSNGIMRSLDHSKSIDEK